MDLIKENKFKKRAVFFDGKKYYKTWYFNDVRWLIEHISFLNKYAPGLVHDYTSTDNSMTLIMNEVKGTPANTFDHTDKFIDKIYKACVKNIEETAPWVHGDWVLSNIIITDTDEVKFIDWDNINLYPKDAAIEKLHMDLESAFGEKFKRYLNDTSSI